MRRVFLPLMFLLMPLAASAQEVPPWVVRVEGGMADIHRFAAEPKGPMIGVRAARVWSPDVVRIDFGAMTSSADEGVFMADIGLELRLAPAGYFLTPFIAGFVGTLVEPTYSYSHASRAGVGIEIRLAPRQAIRIGMFRGRHSRDARGPHAIVVGYSWRVGKTIKRE